MKKLVALFMVLVLFAGCPAEEEEHPPIGGGEEEEETGMEEHLRIEEGTQTQISAGEREEGGTGFPPALEYKEKVNENLFVYFTGL